MELNLNLDFSLEDFPACPLIPEFPLAFQYELHHFLQVFLHLFDRPPLAEGSGYGIHPSYIPFIALLNGGLKCLFHTVVSLFSIQQPVN